LAAAHAGQQKMPVVEVEALWWVRRRRGECRGAMAGGGTCWWAADARGGRRGTVVGAEVL
jgi:hypothetical protein